MRTDKGSERFDLSQPITKNMTLYAHWKQDLLYWGAIWNRNILGVMNHAKEDDTTETPVEKPSKEEILVVYDTDPIYDEAKLFNDGYAVVRMGKYYGVIDTDGNFVIPTEYDAIGRFSEGYAVALKKDDKDDKSESYITYILNAKTGEAVCPTYQQSYMGEIDDYNIYSSSPKVLDEWFCQEGVINVCGFPCSPDGTVLVLATDILSQLSDEMCGPCVGGIFPVKWTWGLLGSSGVDYYDKTGKIVHKVACEAYDKYGWYSVYLALAPVDDRILWIPDESAKLPEPDTYIGRIGLLDGNYNEIMKPKYNSFRYSLSGEFFIGGLLVVELDGKYGAIDRDGNEVIPLIYDSLSTFKNGYTFAFKDGKGCMLDTKGNTYEIVGPNGESTNVTDCSWVNSDGIFVAYDSISKKTFCVSTKLKDGKMYGIPGTENLNSDPFDASTAEGMTNYIYNITEELTPYKDEESGKWGYYHLVLPESFKK